MHLFQKLLVTHSKWNSVLLHHWLLWVQGICYKIPDIFSKRMWPSPKPHFLLKFQQNSVRFFLYLKVFFNKHTIFHDIKLKLQQKHINKKKRYIRLRFKWTFLNVKNQKNKTRTKTKQTITKTTKTPKEIYKDKKKHKKEIHSIFPNDFSHVVYLFPY